MTKNENSEKIQVVTLEKVDLNKTTLFMLPGLELDRRKTGFKLLRYFGFVNCYLKHKQGLEQDESCIVMVFNPSKEVMPKFAEFHKMYSTYPNYVEDYIIDQNVIALVFKVKSKWIKSFHEFKQSRYSKMSEEYANLFKIADPVSGWEVKNKEYHVIMKSPELKEAIEEALDIRIHDSWELASPLDPSKEEFDYDYREIKI